MIKIFLNYLTKKFPEYKVYLQNRNVSILQALWFNVESGTLINTTAKETNLAVRNYMIRIRFNAINKIQCEEIGEMLLSRINQDWDIIDGSPPLIIEDNESIFIGELLLTIQTCNHLCDCCRKEF